MTGKGKRLIFAFVKYSRRRNIATNIADVRFEPQNFLLGAGAAFYPLCYEDVLRRTRKYLRFTTEHKKNQWQGVKIWRKDQLNNSNFVKKTNDHEKTQSCFLSRLRRTYLKNESHLLTAKSLVYISRLFKAVPRPPPRLLLNAVSHTYAHCLQREGPTYLERK